MVSRPVIPKDLSKWPDFPVKNDLSQEDYDVVIIAYWAAKKKEKRKLAREEFKLYRKAANLLDSYVKVNDFIKEKQIKKIKIKPSATD